MASARRSGRTMSCTERNACLRSSRRRLAQPRGRRRSACSRPCAGTRLGCSSPTTSRCSPCATAARHEVVVGVAWIVDVCEWLRRLRRRPGEAPMLFAVLLTVASVAVPQDATPQKRFEAGKFQEAIDKVKARNDASESDVYLRALAHRKLNQNDDAKEAFGSLADREGVWSEIGKSGRAQVEGNLD